MENNYFTVLMNLMTSAIHQNESAVCRCMSPPSGASRPPPAPSHTCGLPWSTGFGLPVSHGKFPPATSFIKAYGKGDVSVLPSQFVPPSSSLTVSKACPLCLSRLPPCKQNHQYHLSRFHALIYDICFSFSDLLHSV